MSISGWMDTLLTWPLRKIRLVAKDIEKPAAMRMAARIILQMIKVNGNRGL